jgi:hypothetical protein
MLITDPPLRARIREDLVLHTFVATVTHGGIEAVGFGDKALEAAAEAKRLWRIKARATPPRSAPD